VQRIRSTRRPQNKDHVNDFLGLVGYYQKFIPSITELTHDLQKMLSKEARFRGFMSTKKLLSNYELSDRRKFSNPSWLLKLHLLGSRCKPCWNGSSVSTENQRRTQPHSVWEKSILSLTQKVLLASETVHSNGLENWVIPLHYINARKFTLLTDPDSLQLLNPTCFLSLDVKMERWRCTCR